MWKKMLLIVLAVVVLVIGTAWIWASRTYTLRMAQAEAAWAQIQDNPNAAEGPFDATMVAGLEEVAQRYFARAIAPGTPLSRTVELTMSGQFLLGEADDFKIFQMEARQILNAPDAFVWIADMASGRLRISGSDALNENAVWTRFWMARTIPLVRASDTPDLRRSALTRPGIEAVWAPASLLPQFGTTWEQTGPDTARVTLATGIVFDMTLAADGRVTEVVSDRWSNANPDNAFRLQPFGGTFDADATFAGYTIPAVVHVGNLYGTDAYLPFFNATITNAEYR